MPGRSLLASDRPLTLAVAMEPGGADVGRYKTLLGSPTLPANCSNVSVISGRYDINSYFYAKLEGHFIRGTALNYYVDSNPAGEKTATNMLAAKVGFSF